MKDTNCRNNATECQGAGQQITASASYIHRPQYWAIKVLQEMARCGAANEIGPAGYTLVAVVAGFEDMHRYKTPVTFFNAQLMLMIGVTSHDTLIKVRAKAVEAGWLYYVQGGKNRAGVYASRIPDVDGCARNSRAHTKRIQTETRDDPERISEPSNPVPEPNPSPLASGWGMVERQLTAAGVNAVECAVRAAKKSGVTPEHCLRIVAHFHSMPKAWGPIVLYRRIIAARMDLPPDEEWPKPNGKHEADRRGDEYEKQTAAESARMDEQAATIAREKKEREQLLADVNSHWTHKSGEEQQELKHRLTDQQRKSFHQVGGSLDNASISVLRALSSLLDATPPSGNPAHGKHPA